MLSLLAQIRLNLDSRKEERQIKGCWDTSSQTCGYGMLTHVKRPVLTSFGRHQIRTHYVAFTDRDDTGISKECETM